MALRHLLTGTSYASVDSGAYATIFADPAAGKAIKLFKRAADRAHVADVFWAELEAYEAIQAIPELCAITPRYYGAKIISAVEDADETDVSLSYELACAFEMEFVPAKFEKIGSLFEVGARLRRLFLAHRISHITDAGVATLPDGSIRVIDFAVRYVEPPGSPNPFL